VRWSGVGRIGGWPTQFFCHARQKTFSKILALVDYEEGEMRCPHCGSANVEQRWSAFTAITSKKSA
jgi:RNA polymerase subunit RPABC4/transcription elongation factor Spt4